MTHDLKIWPVYFFAVWSERKTFEVRKADRLFEPGDQLKLREWDPDTSKYTGNEITVSVSYVLTNAPGVELGYSVLAIHPEAATLVAQMWCDQPGFNAKVVGIAPKANP